MRDRIDTSSLEALFIPFVEKIVRPQVEAEMAMTDAERAEVEAEINKVRALPDGKCDKNKKNALINMLKVLRAFYEELFTPEEIAEEVKNAVDEEAAKLVLACVNVMILSANHGVIEVATLDDAMLPPMNPEVCGAFDRCVSQGYLDRQSARDVLRQLRQSLPAGKALPDEFVERLAECGIKVA